MKSKKNIIIIIIAVLVISIIVYNSLSQPGMDQLKTKFKETAFVRNEQNSGPVLRAYIVTANQLDLKEMEIYGNFMPHTKYGNTKVYFFDSSKPFPKTVSLNDPYFDKQFEENRLAVYEKDGMGKVSVK